MKNLNVEQIMKALECCKTIVPEDCIKCPYRNKGIDLFASKGNSLYTGCVNTLAKDALALIKELTEENERLIGELAERPPKLIITKLSKGE